MSYEVRVVSGPAKGWGYVTFIPPDEVIHVAPIPTGRDKHGAWFRVHVDHRRDPSWPGQQRYRRTAEIPDETKIAVPFDRLSVEGDIIVEYEHVPDA